MSDWVWLVIYALAVARVVGLIAEDEITRPARETLVRWASGAPGRAAPTWTYLYTCQWCASIWVAAAAVPLIWFYDGRLWLMLPALGLALSQFTGMTSRAGRG